MDFSNDEWEFEYIEEDLGGDDVKDSDYEDYEEYWCDDMDGEYE